VSTSRKKLNIRFGMETLARTSVVSGFADAKYAIFPTYESGELVAINPI
jgi:hypothetical protein